VLEQLSEQVRGCLEHAADAKAKADLTDDPVLKAEFLDMEKRWLILARSYGFTESLEDFTTANLERRRKFDERLRANTGSEPETRADQFPRPASNVESSDNWLDDTLHQVSIMLIDGGNLDSLYNRILDAAVVLMSSDMASMQSLDPERNRLRLLAWKGFHPQSARFWEWVYLDSASTCGLALFSGGRVVVPDVETSDFMAGTADLDEYRRSNIRAVQSTPLLSRFRSTTGHDFNPLARAASTHRTCPAPIGCACSTSRRPY